MQVLSTNDIYYLETRDRLLWYHTAKGEFSVRASLASAEKQLAQYHFSRCNQCYLVNLQYVKAVENDFVHVNTDRLEISRRQRAAFLTAVASYIGGGLGASFSTMSSSGRCCAGVRRWPSVCRSNTGPAFASVHWGCCCR